MSANSIPVSSGTTVIVSVDVEKHCPLRAISVATHLRKLYFKYYVRSLVIFSVIYFLFSVVFETDIFHNFCTDVLPEVFVTTSELDMEASVFHLYVCYIEQFFNIHISGKILHFLPGEIHYN